MARKRTVLIKTSPVLRTALYVASLISWVITVIIITGSTPTPWVEALVMFVVAVIQFLVARYGLPEWFAD